MDISSANTLIVHFAGNTIRFNTDHAGLLTAVNTHFKHCLGETGSHVAEYEITTLGEDEFSISRNGSDLFSKLSNEQVLFQLMQDGLTQLNGASTNELVFHAAALAYQDRGLLLCGKSGSGKSTLAARLVADGFQYLTDEVISYPLDGNEISGFCRSLVLKKGSVFIWQKLLAQNAADGLLEFKDGNAWVAPTLFNVSAVRSAVRPRILIFPRYVPEVAFQVAPLTTANTLFRLLQTLVNARNFPDHGLSVTSQIARQVSAYSLVYSDIEIASQWIQQVITLK